MVAPDEQAPHACTPLHPACAGWALAAARSDQRRQVGDGKPAGEAFLQKQHAPAVVHAALAAHLRCRGFTEFCLAMSRLL